MYEATKRYFAKIMMPFRNRMAKNIQKISAYDIDMIVPSHGQIYDRPAWIMEAYPDWVNSTPHNLVVLPMYPYVSTHGSTGQMVDHLTSALTRQGVRVELFNLAVTDIGNLAISRQCPASKGANSLHYRILWMGRKTRGNPGLSDIQSQGRGSGPGVL